MHTHSCVCCAFVDNSKHQENANLELESLADRLPNSCIPCQNIIGRVGKGQTDYDCFNSTCIAKMIL